MCRIGRPAVSSVLRGVGAVDNDVFSRIFSVASAAWTFVLGCAVALFKAWPNIMARINERRRDEATEKGSDWDRRTEEINRLHALLANREKLLADRDAENELLRQENTELRRDKVTAEATLQGYGEARNRLALEDAQRRAIELAAKSGNGK